MAGPMLKSNLLAGQAYIDNYKNNHTKDVFNIKLQQFGVESNLLKHKKKSLMDVANIFIIFVKKTIKYIFHTQTQI